MENKKSSNKVVYIVVAIIIALISFLGGYFVYPLTESEDVKIMKWMLKSIKEDYYYADTISEKDYLMAMSEGVKQLLLDKYSTLYTKEEIEILNKSYQGIKEGFGMNFDAKSEKAKVIRVLGNSPAEKGGMKDGDLIIGIRFLKDESFTLTNTYVELSDFLSKLTKDDDIVFKVLRGDVEVILPAMRKAEFKEKNVWYYNNKTNSKYDDKKLGEHLQNLDDDSALIVISSFTGTMSSQFSEAMATYKAEGKKKLIIDLRSNGGGDLNLLSNMLSHLLKDGNEKKIGVLVEDYKGTKNDTLIKTPTSKYDDYIFNNVVIIADGNTASASEAMIGAMLDHGMISPDEIIGTKTYGKGIMQTTKVNPFTGYGIKLTTAKVLWPKSKTCIHEIGISPTPENNIELIKSYPFNEGKDNQLLRAVEVLNRI